MANKSSSSGTSPAYGKTEVEAIVDLFIKYAEEFTARNKREDTYLKIANEVNIRCKSDIWNQKNVQKFYNRTSNFLKANGEFPDYMQHLLPGTLQNFKYICKGVQPLSEADINNYIGIVEDYKNPSNLTSQKDIFADMAKSIQEDEKARFNFWIHNLIIDYRNYQKTKNQLKENFLNRVDDFIADSTDAYGDEILEAIFFFCRDCNQASIEPDFSEEEREKVHQLLVDAIPLFDRDLELNVNTLGPESAKRLRIIRSGLEFVKDTFAKTNAWLKYDLTNLMVDREVKILDKNLILWKDYCEEGDIDDDPIDLRGVPQSHNWWSELEREDSKRVFGQTKIWNGAVWRLVSEQAKTKLIGYIDAGSSHTVEAHQAEESASIGEESMENDDDTQEVALEAILKLFKALSLEQQKQLRRAME